MLLNTKTRILRTPSAPLFSHALVLALCVLLSWFQAAEAAEANRKANAAASRADDAKWGSYLKPFAANSLWNSRPVEPVLGDFVIPTSDYFPTVSEGAYSTGIFLAKASDGPVTVTGLPGGKGLWDPDAEAVHDVTIPHWPAEVVPAAGSDGHADIVDPIAGIVHSFFQLRFQDGRWVASQYAWTRLDGSGWGDPAHYFQGARAAAVPTTAGLIRKHEINDGDSLYRHALAMSLTFNALAAKPAYVFPATSADGGAESTNSGRIPEGALVMLPEMFDTAQISNADLRKVAETLKVYGAYIVDRNVGTPFVIYVENGSGFNLHKAGWNNAVAADLQKIRGALRQVVTTAGYVDGNGLASPVSKNLNLLSMRGPWQLTSGSGAAPGTFDTWAQAVNFPATSTRVTQVNYSSRGMNPVSWGVPVAGTMYRLTALTTGGAKLRLQIRDQAGAIIFDSGELGNNEVATFKWPSQNGGIVLHAISGTGQASSVRGEIFGLAS